MLKQLTAKGVGPFDPLEMTFAPRINLVTGDNGVGKTFLLDLCWYVLTGEWADPLKPALGKDSESSIITGESNSRNIASRLINSNYNWVNVSSQQKSIPLILYIGVQGNFRFYLGNSIEKFFDFTEMEIWEGKKDKSGKAICNGLLDDLVSWQYDLQYANFYFIKALDTLFEDKEFNKDTFQLMLKNALISNNYTKENNFNYLADYAYINILKKVISDLVPDFVEKNTLSKNVSYSLFSNALKILSPNIADPMTLSKEPKTAFGDSRKILFLQHAYGEEPMTLASAGMKRIISVCYFLIWAWQRNLEQQRDNQLPAIDQIIILFDEVESHLHPAWQRKILPAFVEAMAQIHDNKVDVQLIATTHSPLVAASLDGVFDSKTDRLFTLEQDPQSGLVHAEAFDTLEIGDASHWLQSEVFGHTSPYSSKACLVLEAAEAYMEGKRGQELPNPYNTVEQIHQGMQDSIPSYDNIWPRWEAYISTQPAKKPVKKKGKKA